MICKVFEKVEQKITRDKFDEVLKISKAGKIACSVQLSRRKGDLHDSVKMGFKLTVNGMDEGFLWKI